MASLKRVIHRLIRIINDYIFSNDIVSARVKKKKKKNRDELPIGFHKFETNLIIIK